MHGSDPNKSESVAEVKVVKRRKIGVIKTRDNSESIPSEVIIQIPSDDESETFEPTGKSFETQSKLESDVWMFNKVEMLRKRGCFLFQYFS